MNLMILKSIRGNPLIACMLAIDIVIAGILIYNKLNAHFPNPEYMHLLVTYHFGFLKRALGKEFCSLRRPGASRTR